jgi:hypothetical protein
MTSTVTLRDEGELVGVRHQSLDRTLSASWSGECAARRRGPARAARCGGAVQVWRADHAD